MMKFFGRKSQRRQRKFISRAVMEACESREMLSFTAVPTFECLSLYWSPTGGGSAVQATVKYKVAGTTTWNNAQDLWYAAAESTRPSEYRGSIVGLKSGTTYDVEVQMAGYSAEDYQATTWSENFPVAQTIVVSNTSIPLEINGVHGSPNGYILYTGPATIDAANAQPYNIRIQNSDYIIIRGLTLTGATGDGILLGSSTSSNSSPVHDIVIENNDISNWGTVIPGYETQGWGYDDQSAIRSSSSALERVIIQRNKLHNPRTDANSWKETNGYYGTSHPEGPQGITFENGPTDLSKGNFVIRYNEIYSDNTHRFNDTMGGDNNFGYNGFLIKDSDVYGNYCAYTWDDGMEIEGAGMNVRVWGNYTDYTYTGVAMSEVSMGPFYVFRNVFQHSQTGESPYSSYGGDAFKRGGGNGYPSDGRIYIYNNTLFYTGSPTFQAGISNRTDTDYATNTIAYNNILRVRGNSGDKSVYDQSTDSIYDYDLYNGLISTPIAQEQHGISGLPTYVSGAGFNSTTKTGVFQLTSSSLGYDGGKILPNFTDGYDGAGPDMGAHEANKAAMEYGVNAYLPIAWDGAATGTWDVATNWTNDNMPDTATENVLIDGNANQNTTVTYTLPIGTNANIGSLTVDTSDALILNKNTAVGSASMTINSALNNSGTITLGGSSAGTAHGNTFTVTVTDGSRFNRGTGTIYFKSLASYRRGLAIYSLPANNTNDGAVYVQNISTQGGGKVRLGLTGSGTETFTNNGTISVEGSGSDNSVGGQQPWAVFGPSTANASLTLAGTGSLTLSTNLSQQPDSFAMIAGIASGTSFTNAASHTIKGSGYVGYGATDGASGNTMTVYNFSSLTNAGLIRAEMTTNWTTLGIAATGGSVTNTGRMVAGGSAGTILKVGSDTTAGTFTNSGVLDARSGSTINIGTMVTATLNGTINGGGTYVAPTLALSGTATLQPGNLANNDGTGASTVGLMTVTGNMTLASGTTLNFQLGAPNTRGTDYDAVSVSGNLTLDGTLNVTNLTGFAAGTYRLFTFAANGLTDNTLNLGTMPTGYVCNIVTNSAAGTVDLVVANGLMAPTGAETASADTTVAKKANTLKINSTTAIKQVATITATPTTIA